jgi:maleate cis-trans isomerase
VTIAWIYPDVVDRIHQDFFRMTPPDVNLAIFTKLWSLKMMHSNRFSIDAFAKQRDDILNAAKEMGAYPGNDYIVVSGDLIQAAMGPEWDRNLSNDIERVSGKPATTAMTAVVDALRNLNAMRIAVATPFREEQNEHMRRYLEAADFEVTAIRGAHTVTSQDLRNLPADLAYRQARSVFETDPDVDAVYIACPVWRGVSDSIERLEAELGVPVVTMFSPVLWKALRTLRHPAHISGFGRLLASLSTDEVLP